MEHGAALPAAQPRPNRGAGYRAFAWAFAAYFVALVAVLPHEHVRRHDFVAGELLPAAVLGWLATWGVAHGSTRRWSWWVYPLVAVSLVAVVSAMVLVRAERHLVAGGTGHNSAPPLHELVAPEGQGNWIKLDTATAHQAEDLAARAKDQMGPGVDSVVAGLYDHHAPLVRVLFVGINGTLDEGASLESQLRDAMAGYGVNDYDTFEPGAAEGALGCGNAAKEGQRVLVCMWMGNQRTVMATWSDPELDAEQAAALTAELRDLAAAE
jgi:hypothetical protein